MVRASRTTEAPRAMMKRRAGPGTAPKLSVPVTESCCAAEESYCAVPEGEDSAASWSACMWRAGDGRCCRDGPGCGSHAVRIGDRRTRRQHGGSGRRRRTNNGGYEREL